MYLCIFFHVLHILYGHKTLILFFRMKHLEGLDQLLSKKEYRVLQQPLQVKLHKSSALSGSLQLSSDVCVINI